MPAREEPHDFDRRVSDVNVAAISTELRALSETVHDRIGPALDDNTRICTDLRKAVFGHGDDDGLAMKVQEMHDVFTAGRNGMRVLSAVGNGVMWTIEKGGKIAKPLFWLALLVGSIVTYWKTGNWPQGTP
jgi:hypothetical protein